LEAEIGEKRFEEELLKVRERLVPEEVAREWDAARMVELQRQEEQRREIENQHRQEEVRRVVELARKEQEHRKAVQDAAEIARGEALFQENERKSRIAREQASRLQREVNAEAERRMTEWAQGYAQRSATLNESLRQFVVGLRAKGSWEGCDALAEALRQAAAGPEPPDTRWASDYKFLLGMVADAHSYCSDRRRPFAAQPAAEATIESESKFSRRLARFYLEH
jgi:hypothetical protein